MQKNLHLDYPPQIVIEHVSSDAESPYPPTSVIFRYSSGFAHTAAFNEGPDNIEGSVIIEVKKAFGVNEVLFATQVIDYKVG